jgi:uncharacterized membrane protein YphA (DoxX/SURF4 family)
MTTNTVSNTIIAPTTNTKTSIARHVPTAARYALGAAFFVFGLNGFLNFIPPPTEPMPEGAVAFGMALMKSGYLFQLIKGTEVLAGFLLLANRFVPLALVLLAPVLVNIVAFHLWLLPSGIGLSLVLFGLELYLAWTYRRVYAPLLQARTAPTAS